MADAISWYQVGLIVAFVAALGGAYRWINGIQNEEADKRAELAQRFYDFKLYVAQNYVSASALKDTEERLITGMEKLSSRIEQLVARLDKMAIDVVGRLQPPPK